MCLGALGSVFDLMQISASSRANSDARIMAAATGIPAVIWAILSTGMSLAILFFALRLAYRRHRTPH